MSTATRYFPVCHTGRLHSVDSLSSAALGCCGAGENLRNAEDALLRDIVSEGDARAALHLLDGNKNDVRLFLDFARS